jgi:hypothetical protein
MGNYIYGSCIHVRSMLMFWIKYDRKYKLLWHVDLLLGKDVGTNKETTAVAVHRLGKHASTTI